MKQHSTFFEVLDRLTTAQTQELLKETFGEKNARYHTLDEIPLNKLIAKLSEHDQLIIKIQEAFAKADKEFWKPENVENRERQRRQEIAEFNRIKDRPFTI
jgi:hypothetical protein